MGRGHKSVLTLMVRLPWILVDGACRFRMMAVVWLLEPYGMTAMEARQVTSEFMNTKNPRGCKSLGTLMVRLLRTSVDGPCRCPLMVIVWLLVLYSMMTVDSTLVTSEFMNTTFQHGCKSVLTLMVRLLGISLDIPCQFPQMAAVWLLEMGEEVPLVAWEFTNTTIQSGCKLPKFMVRLLGILADIVCRFPLMAAVWLLEVSSMMAVVLTLVTSEFINCQVLSLSSLSSMLCS